MSRCRCVSVEENKLEARAALEAELKQLIIDALMLEDVTAEEINSEDPLFDEGLGLDSIDALELGMAISKKYKIKINQNQEENRHHFASVRNLAEFVATKLSEAKV